jgi:hypothetical protein
MKAMSTLATDSISDSNQQFIARDELCYNKDLKESKAITKIPGFKI